MYCSFFGFRERPFNTTPDPSFVYLSTTHQEAFAHLLYGIDNHCGFIKLVGEVGTGKTTVLRTLLARLDATNYRTALIFNPCHSAEGLLQTINREYGLPWKGLADHGLVEVLNEFLLQQNAEGKTVVLVIDEAQNLKPHVLEQIRLISNLETDRDKLVQIVLAGQPELESLLSTPELRQLNQRMAVKYTLFPMGYADTRDYIRHRISVAGGDVVGFSAAALRKIFKFSKGYPRLINIACDRVLLLAYNCDKREVSSLTAARAIRDISKGERRGSRFRLAWTAGVCAVAVVSGILAYAHTTIHKAIPVCSSGDRVNSLQAALVRTTEHASAIAAVNALSGTWKAPPLAASKVPGGEVDFEAMAAALSLQVCSFRGTPEALLRLNSPAIVEVAMPGSAGRRFIAITGVSGERLRISPPNGGGKDLSRADLQKIWAGRWHVLWKNVLNIPRGLRPGSRGESVKRLQALLRDAGVYTGRMTGIYDPPTAAAVAKFQEIRGIQPDGTVGKQTLMLLYRTAAGYFAPALVEKGGSDAG